GHRGDQESLGSAMVDRRPASGMAPSPAHRRLAVCAPSRIADVEPAALAAVHPTVGWEWFEVGGTRKECFVDRSDVWLQGNLLMNMDTRAWKRAPATADRSDGWIYCVGRAGCGRPYRRAGMTTASRSLPRSRRTGRAARSRSWQLPWEPGR